jgi:HSP20 family molecular chaperone IbpA
MASHMALEPAVSPTVYRLLPKDPFLKEVKRIHSDIAKRAYELSAASGFSRGHELEDWLKAEAELLVPVSVEVVEHRNEVTVKAHLPGFDHDDVEVYAEPGRLFLRASHQEEPEMRKDEAEYLREISRVVFRTIDLPCEIDPDRAKASLVRGTIEIILPKVQAAKLAPTLVKAA